MADGHGKIVAGNGRRRKESLDNGLQDDSNVKITITAASRIKHRGLIRRIWGQFKQANPLINTWRYYNRV